jgi:nucleoside phosphorylase
MPTTIGISRDSYTVALICALPVEMAATVAVLDEMHEEVQPKRDHQIDYVLGRIGVQNVVISCPIGLAYLEEPGTILASKIRSQFPSIRSALMVGVGGSVPKTEPDVGLGDVVVNTLPGDFQVARRLPDPQVIQDAIFRVNAKHLLGDRTFQGYLSLINRKSPILAPRFARPSQDDCLYITDYNHCDGAFAIHDGQKFETVSGHGPLNANAPLIRYVSAPSLTQVIDDSRLFRSSSSGKGELDLKDSLPSVLIQGIADYSDSHKNRAWQEYAAATAAAYAKELLLTMNGPATRTGLLDDAYESASNHSDTESIFSEASIPSSQSSSVELAFIAVTQLAGLLLNDHVLKPLYSRAISTVGLAGFQNELVRFIRNYGRDLHKDASNFEQRQAAGFIHHSATRIAVYMRRALVHDTAELVLEQELDMRHAARIDDWLRSQQESPGHQSKDTDEVPNTVDDLLEDGELDDLPSYEQGSYSNLDKIKEFMVSTQAILNLRHEVRTWVEANDRDHVAECPAVPEDGSTLVNSTNNTLMKAPSLWTRTRDIVYPPPAGYVRLHYPCVSHP